MAYNENVFSQAPLEGTSFPLEDEPFIKAWEQYLGDAQTQGVFSALAERLVPLRFPVQEGINKSEAYLAATRKGEMAGVPEKGGGLELQEPDRLTLDLWPTPAGRIPVLFTSCRADFVALVQALGCRNEPQPIPDSMGATIIAGLNNWDRIHAYRRDWARQHPTAPDEAAWKEEFKKLLPRKELYQDRLIVLSAGPYSGVSAAQMGLEEVDWAHQSLQLRREHEGTHYFTRRVFNSMRNNLLDEMLADYRAIVVTLGRFRADWLLMFMGLEAYPRYREGGRLQNYLGKPPLSEGAVPILAALVHAAAHNLEWLETRLAAPDAQRRVRDFLSLSRLTLEEMASRAFMTSFAEELISK